MLESGYDVMQLSEIYLFEVAPVVGNNLWVSAGVWDGFDQAWLHAQACKRAQSRGLILRLWIACVIGRKWMTYATESHWQEILAIVRKGIIPSIDRQP